MRNDYSTSLGIYLVVQHTRRMHTGAVKRPRPISISSPTTMPTHKHAAVRVLGKEFVLGMWGRRSSRRTDRRTIRCRNEHGEMLAVIARTTSLAVVRVKAHYMTDILQRC